MQETRVPPLDGEDPLKKGMKTHSSILAWDIPWTEEPGRLPSMGLQSWTRLSMQAPGLIIRSSSWHSEAGPKAPSWTFLAWIPFCQILGTLHHFLLRWCIFGHNKWIHGTSRTDLGIDTVSNPEAKSEKKFNSGMSRRVFGLHLKIKMRIMFVYLFCIRQ